MAKTKAAGSACKNETQASVKEQIRDAMRSGASEIEHLREANRALATKAEAFDTIAGLVRLLTPRANQGYALDVAWNMRRLLEDLEKTDC